MSTRVAFGTVDSEDQAYDVVSALDEAGFSSDEISVLLPHHRASTEFVHEVRSKAPEGSTIGASIGGAAGGLIGLLAGIGTLTIPGLGPLIAAGPIVGLLSGLGAGGAIGGLSGALAGLGIPEVEAKLYESQVAEGLILITVDCGNDQDRARRARTLLEERGARNVTVLGAKAAQKVEKAAQKKAQQPTTGLPPQDTTGY
jgi:hypothetical protein